MNLTQKTLFLLGVISAAHANAQGLVAGWDFSDVLNLNSANVNGYAAEKTAFNNGVTTSGSISTSLAQGTQTFFAANGAAAGQPQFNDGFSTTTSDLFGGAETGQQSLNFTAGSSFNVVFNFTDAYNVTINADWLTSTTGGSTDILDISYSSDGGSNWTTYDKGNGQYAALASTTGWTQSTGNAGGFIGFVNGGAQSDMVIDLTSVTPDQLSTVNAVRFEFVNLSANERVGLDNVHITGTAVDVSSSRGGSLFILDNPASFQLVGDWYRTPMGDLFTANSPWLWSNDFGWNFSPQSNTANQAYVYIQSPPFQCWVFVDQDSATTEGFWGYAFNAATPALSGWFWFFNEASTNNVGQYFIWDNEGNSALTFDDSAQVP